MEYNECSSCGKQYDLVEDFLVPSLMAPDDEGMSYCQECAKDYEMIDQLNMIAFHWMLENSGDNRQEEE